MRLFALCAVLLLPCAPAVAHPGHGATDSTTVAHYLLEPVHAAPVVVAAVIFAGARWLMRRHHRLHRAAVRKQV
jgi:hypothetical protein